MILSCAVEGLVAPVAGMDQEDLRKYQVHRWHHEVLPVAGDAPLLNCLFYDVEDHVVGMLEVAYSPF